MMAPGSCLSSINLTFTCLGVLPSRGVGGCCKPSVLAGATPGHDAFFSSGSHKSPRFALSPSAKVRASPVEGGTEVGTVWAEVHVMVHDSLGELGAQEESATTKGRDGYHSSGS